MFTELVVQAQALVDRRGHLCVLKNCKPERYGTVSKAASRETLEGFEPQQAVPVTTLSKPKKAQEGKPAPWGESGSEGKRSGENKSRQRQGNRSGMVIRAQNRIRATIAVESLQVEDAQEVKEPLRRLSTQK